jgi:hypothetical protein
VYRGEFHDAIREDRHYFTDLVRIQRGLLCHVQVFSRSLLVLALAIAPAAFLIATNNDIQALVNRTSALPKTLTADADAVVKLVTSTVATVKSDVDSLASQAKVCGTDAQSDTKELQDKVLKEIKFLLGEREFDTAALELGDQVRKLTLQQLPSTISIPLVDTGRRDPGDQFTLKFAVGAANKPREVLDTRTLTMYRILWHTDLKATLIWADPEKKTAVSHFQAAPAYNVMLKRGSRKHVLWNSLFDPGFGLNLAAQDFNHDDGQELGIGLAVSAVRDFITVGYGYNVSQGAKYWFFGLRLPVPVPARWERDRPMASCWTGSSCPRNGP